jgi:hypothetical protein
MNRDRGCDSRVPEGQAQGEKQHVGTVGVNTSGCHPVTRYLGTVSPIYGR